MSNWSGSEGPPPGDNWLRNVDVWNDAKAAGVVGTYADLVNAVASGELPAHPVGAIGLWFREDEVQKWIAQRRTKERSEPNG